MVKRAHNGKGDAGIKSSKGTPPLPGNGGDLKGDQSHAERGGKIKPGGHKAALSKSRKKKGRGPCLAIASGVSEGV